MHELLLLIPLAIIGLWILYKTFIEGEKSQEKIGHEAEPLAEAGGKTGVIGQDNRPKDVLPAIYEATSVINDKKFKSATMDIKYEYPLYTKGRLARPPELDITVIQGKPHSIIELQEYLSR